MIRLIGAVAGAVLVISVSAPVAAHSSGTAHYVGTCASGNGADNRQYYLDPVAHITDNYDYVASTVTVRSLRQCSNPTGPTNGGFSLVNAANLRLYPVDLLQFGYGVCDDSLCGPTFPSTTNVEEFWYTFPVPGEDPGTIHAATWVDFDGGGHDRPVVGRSYTFSIEIVKGTPSYYNFCVKDNYQGITDCYAVTPYYSTPYAWYPWWSFEAQNSASAMGNLAYETNIYIGVMKYSTKTTGATTLTGSSQTCYALPSMVARYTCSVSTDTGGYTRLNARTVQHGG